jgi:hypothetical protein
MKEYHPYIKHFDSNHNWEYLIIGTFPPNRDVREPITDYFYGNRGTLWKIIGQIYPSYNFEEGTRQDRLDQMISWQLEYNVGITDTLLSVTRKRINSPNDSDLILDSEDYNYSLKDYVIQNNSRIRKILFTSSKGDNSAYETFKVIMGSEIDKISEKLCSRLPSPSGSSNLSWFNVDNEETLGLHPDFFYFIKTQKDQLTQQHFLDRWELKELKKKRKGTNSNIDIPRSPEGLVNEFKVWSYRQVLPKQH